MRATTVTSTNEKYRVEIQMGPHHLIGDEPPELGGGDTGPSPFELLAASLGSCKAMTMQMYADRKGWPLKGVTILITQEKQPDRYRFDVELRFEGELSAEQRARLKEVSEHCPVQRTLNETIEVHSQIID